MQIDTTPVGPPLSFSFAETMAVIQDLPPELLHRILELIYPGLPDNYYGSDHSPLASCALVARRWRAPSQALLYKIGSVDGARRGVGLLHHLEQHPHLSLRDLTVEPYIDLTFLRRLLKLSPTLKTLSLWLTLKKLMLKFSITPWPPVSTLLLDCHVAC